MKYVMFVKYENKITLKNFLKNYLNVGKFAYQKIEIESKSSLALRFVLGIVNIFSKFRIGFNDNLTLFYVLSRNDCNFIFDINLIDKKVLSKQLLIYGDSIVKSKEKYWYEARPKYSKIHFVNQDYIGDVVITNFKVESFLDLRILLIQSSIKVDKVDRAISKRTSKIDNSFGIPILYDQRTQPLVSARKVNEELSLSVLIPTNFTKSQHYSVEESILSLLKVAHKVKLEIILLSHRTKREELNDLINNFANRIEIRSIEYFEDFNFSKVINLGVAESSFEYILIMNDDVILDNESDLIHLLNHLSDENDLGSVGIKMFDQSGKILHAGLEYRNGEPQHFLKGSDSNFLKNSHSICREVSGCTGAFLAFKKTIFVKVGKMNENFPLDFNDVELMLKIERDGLKNIICSKVSANHAESLTRGITALEVISDDLKLLSSIHGRLPNRDPFLYTPADRIYLE